MKEIDKARLRRLYEHFHWDNSRRLAVDEFAIHRGHRYATVVYSIDTKKVLWLDRGRSRATLRKFFNLLTPEQKAGIRAVAMDQNSAFDLEVKENCPNGVVVSNSHSKLIAGTCILHYLALTASCSSYWAWNSEWNPDSPERLVDGPLA